MIDIDCRYTYEKQKRHSNPKIDDVKEFYSSLEDPIDLYDKLKDGINDVTQGNTRPFYEAISDMKIKHSR